MDKARPHLFSLLCCRCSFLVDTVRREERFSLIHVGSIRLNSPFIPAIASRLTGQLPC